MGLQSTVLDFKGDPRLEACLVDDAAHIKLKKPPEPLESGSHVAKIQQALIRLDGLKIDRGELASKTYGPSTAAAVLKYKQKRHIINFSYETQEDNIVGKMTIKSLDDELARKFPFQPIGPDDIIVPPDIPVPPPPPTTPKSRRFQIRCREGFSLGPLAVGLVRLDFDIFDPQNDLSAEYRFVGAALGLGTPISLTDPGPFTEFTANIDISVNGFESPANFNSAGGGNNSAALLTLLAPPMTIPVSTGFTAGFDVVSVSGGVLKLRAFHPGPPRPVPLGGPTTA
jgi:hypothetical protein